MKLTPILVLTLFIAACVPAGSGGDTIKLGWIGPLTGDAANIGQSARAGAEIAVEEINAAGGINGKTLELIIEDGKCAGATASTAANKLLNVDNVPVIIGGACSGETMSFVPMAEQMGRVVVSYCSSVPALTDAGDYIFRTYPSDSFEGKFAANMLYEEGSRKAAVLSCLGDWCAGIKEVFETEFEAAGGEIVASEQYEQTTKDLRTELTKLKNSDADTLYFIGYTEASIVGLKQLAELDWDVKVFGANAWSDPAIPEEVGPSTNGMRFLVSDSGGTEEFTRKMTEHTGGHDVVVCSTHAYDTVYIVADVMKAGATTPDEIKAALYAMPPHVGVAGSIQFDENGDPVDAPLVVKEFRDGGIVNA